MPSRTRPGSPTLLQRLSWIHSRRIPGPEMSERHELRTWQEIANYLGLSVRAVQNYETATGLPVHRLMAQTRGRVWAYTDELDAWKAKASASGEPILLPVPPEDCELASPPPPFLSGHWRYICLVSGLYALLCAEAVILETAYQYDRYGAKAILGAGIVFCFVLAAFFSAAVVDWRRTAQNRSGGLFLCMTVVYGSIALLQFGLRWVLPTAAITEQVLRQPWSAQSAYLKNVVMYFLPMATLYVLLPFHFVLALQRELAANRHGPVLALLTGERLATAPGAVYLRVGWLAAALFVAALLSVVMTQDLFDHLKTSPYKNLFMQLALGRTLLLFGIALLCLLWYSRALNDIKEACLRCDIVRSGGI